MEELPETDDRLIQTLLSDDELVAVIRSQLFVEVKLNQLIEALIPFPEHLDGMRLNWPRQVDLALTLGLTPQHGLPLKILGEIRNRFAHNPEAKLEKDIVNKFYNSFSNEDRDVVDAAFERTKSQLPDFSEENFENTDFKSKYILLVVTLHSYLQLAVREAQQRGPLT